MKQNTDEEFEFECIVDVGKKSTWWVAFLPLKPQLAQHLQAWFRCSYIPCQWAIFQRLPQNSRDCRSGSSQFHSVDPYCWMDCTVRKKDRRLERAKSKNWSSSTWRKNPVRRLLTHLRPLPLRRYLPRCEDWQNYIAYFAYECKLPMLRHQAAENSVITSGAAKKVLFSSIDNCNCWILKQFERTSYFLGIQAWVLRQNGKQKRYA